MAEDGLAAALRARIEGEVVVAGDPGYDRLRSVFNARIDRRPLAIARCASREDVVAALAAGAERGLPVAVRGGGTSDLATLDAGLVVDVGPLDRVAIDPEAATVRVGGGATWRELDAAAQEHGLAVTGARVPRLGVAGVALAGGSGWLERALGPTCAGVVGAEVVLAGGRTARAGDEDPDLLWALRGGAGGFGVVTELELRLHPLDPTLLSGFLGFPRERALEVGGAFRDLLEHGPDELGGALMLGAGIGGACSAVVAFAGSVANGEEAVAPLRALGPSIDAVAPNEYTALQHLFDVRNPHGSRVHLRGGYLRELPDEALERVIAAANRPAAALSHLLLQPLGGALERLDPDAMALRIPDAPWAYRCFGLWPPVESLDRGAIDWVDGIAAALEPYTLATAHPGFLAPRPEPYRSATGGADERATRLESIRQRCDPEGTLRPDPPAIHARAPR
ncbi:MAG: FAD-linked oxidase [Actinomycetes bacterium]|nr:MAG: FAD-linked oxidase [Actinomycetes bacterium]